MSTTSTDLDDRDLPGPDDPVPGGTAADRAATDRDAAPREAARRSGSGLFRAFWRWHFYASLLVIPIMGMLAVTGLVLLFRWQIDPISHPGLLTVQVPQQGAPQPLSAQEAAVRAAFPQAAVTAVQQGAENRATFFTVATGTGPVDDRPHRNVYVNPYTAKVLGSLAPGELPSEVAQTIHGNIVFGSLKDVPLFHDPIVGKDLVLGDLGDRVIELAACWAIVMTLTGYYLFWKGRAARARRIAAGAKAAAMRHRHAVVGALLGVGILGLVASGLPWTGLWGSKVQEWAAGNGLSLWGDDPGAKSTLGAQLAKAGSSNGPVPWAEGTAPLPTSTAAAGPVTIGIDRAVSAALADGLAMPVYVTYPQTPDGVFSVLSDQWHDKANPAFGDVAQERTAHVDRYSGQVIGRYGYGDYSSAAKVVSQGIALHEGRRFGSFNTVATTAFCLGVLFLCVSGPLMWWKRRPRGGGVAAPRGRMPLRSTPWLVAVIVVLGVFLPLFGVSLLLVLALDLAVTRRVPALRRVVGSS